MNHTATIKEEGTLASGDISYPRQSTPPWYKPSVGVVIVLALFLDLFHLGQAGYGNLYYAAGDKSMLSNWHTFFFVSFDPGGFVSIDKPPLGFWLQVASARLFGFTPFSVLLPQALAGVISVALLAHLVRRSYGPVAGLLAGATLAITPISVVTNRSMNVDSLLVMTLLLAAWAISIAAETGQLRFLLLCATLVGLGFNIKMLAAYLVIPAFALLYWFTAPLSGKKRLLHLALATCLLIIISYCWMLAVDLTPATQRPYVGSSGSNSELQLALLYNGYQRYAGTSNLHALPSSVLALLKHLPSFTFVSYQVGNPGFLRLISNPLGSQVGWLFPFALLGLMVVRWDKPTFWPLNRQQQGIALWGTWFTTLYIVFSAIGLMHAYYTVLLAPAICALLGIGTVTTWQDYQHKQRRWLLPLAVIGTAAIQTQLLLAYLQQWEHWLIPLLIVPSLIVAGALLFAQRTMHTHRVLLTSISLVALLLAPTAWSTISLFQEESTPFPAAGPSVQETSLQKLVYDYITNITYPNPSPIPYLLDHQGKASYLVATFDSSTAAPLILETGKPVMALGGYQGSDHILSAVQLNNLIRASKVRFFLLPQLPGKAHLAPALRDYLLNLQILGPFINYQDQAPLTEWISTRCSIVPPAKWSSQAPDSHIGSPFEKNEVLDLYDCASPPLDTK